MGFSLLDRLDRDRVAVDSQDASRLARGRADAPRELREVVGGVKLAKRLLPAVAVDQVVPVGNDVVDRAA